MGAQRDLLPDDLGRDESLGTVGHHLFGKNSVGPSGRNFQILPDEPIHPIALECGDGQDLPEGVKSYKRVDERQKAGAYPQGSVLLMIRKTGREVSPRAPIMKRSSGLGCSACLSDQQEEIDVSERSGCGIDQRPVQRGGCPVNALGCRGRSTARLLSRKVPDFP